MTQVQGTLSTFGHQSLSTRTTQPTTNFGSSGRTDKLAERPFELLKLGTTSKGVTTEVKSGFGPQPASINPNSPSHRFGNRYASDADMFKEGRPGPGAYEHAESVGKQILSTAPTSPDHRIGTGNRFSQYSNVFKADFATPAAGNPRPSSGWLGDKAQYSFHGAAKRSDITGGLPAQRPTYLADPGPGAYEPGSSSLFHQSDSRKPTSSRTRVGTADRDQRYRQYVSKDHEVDLYGKHSPAPNTYNPGHQASSRVRTPQQFGFGSGDRFSQLKSGNAKTLKVLTPGPGSYVV